MNGWRICGCEMVAWTFCPHIESFVRFFSATGSMSVQTDQFKEDCAVQTNPTGNVDVP